MNKQNIALGSALVALVVAVATFLSGGTSHPTVGAAGQSQTAHAYFLDNETVGGYDFATTSQGTATYTAASFVNSRVIEHIASAALTATTPTNAQLSAAGFLPNVGDTQSVFIYASTTKITLAGGTGVTISSASTTKDISPNHVGRLECTRLSALNARLIWCLLATD